MAITKKELAELLEKFLSEDDLAVEKSSRLELSPMTDFERVLSDVEFLKIRTHNTGHVARKILEYLTQEPESS